MCWEERCTDFFPNRTRLNIEDVRASTIEAFNFFNINIITADL